MLAGLGLAVIGFAGMFNFVYVQITMTARFCVLYFDTVRTC